MKHLFPKEVVKKLRKAKVSKRLRGLRGVSLVITTGVTLAIVSGGVFAAHAVVQHNNVITAKAADAKAQQLASDDKTAENAQKTVTGSTDKQGNTTQPKTSSPSSSSSSPSIKYSISSDPGSTAYSTTPPKPNPKSFDITITHNGQFAHGTEISYNATKNEKTYYGGDLVFSVPRVVVHKSDARLASNVFTATIPDGATAGMPAVPWNANQDLWVQADSSASGDGKSWPLSIGIVSSLANGTYQVHLQTFRTAETANGWEYDGFMTVVVEN